ncbi:MAG: DUF368 domain-containing protein [Eubacteriales bacterium]|nr:DUF368 domain-containing protein [Eubacteriales bacterium]
MESQKKESPLWGALKGAIIAMGAMLPGISGGALCVILGIYKPMMLLLSNPLKQIKKQFWFFLPIGIGFLVGALLIAKVLGSFLEAAETAAIFLFIGLILGTIPHLLKEAQAQGVAKGSYAGMIIACLVMLAWMIPMSLAGQSQITPTLGWWCLCGVLWGLGIIVPGMSPSNIFFFLGLATPMYAAIGNLDMSVVLPMGLCLLVSVIALSNGVQYCLKRWYSIFMHGVIGVVLASTLMILPPVKALLTPGYSYATGLTDWLIYLGCLIVGGVCAWAIGNIDKPAPAAK